MVPGIRSLPEASDDAPEDAKQALKSLHVFHKLCVLNGDDSNECMSPTITLAHGLANRKWRMDDKIAENITKLFKGEYTKKGRQFALINGAIRANTSRMMMMSACPVCQRPVDTAHKCHACQKYVHSIICSNPVGEEGHGQAVLCHLCSGKVEKKDGEPKKTQPQEKDDKEENKDEDPKKADHQPKDDEEENKDEGPKKAADTLPQKKDDKEENKDEEPKKEDQQPQKKDDEEENKDENSKKEDQQPQKKDDEEENKDEAPKKAVDFQIVIGMDLMEEIWMLFSRHAEKLQPIRNLCDATAKLAKQMANGIEKKHWLLNPDVIRSIGALLNMDMHGKRVPAITSIISSVNTTLQKNIDLMEKAAFCPGCQKPAPRTNVCDNCNKPTHFDCGSREAGHLEFHCSACLAAKEKDGKLPDPPPKAENKPRPSNDNTNSKSKTGETEPNPAQDDTQNQSDKPSETTENDPTMPTDVYIVTECCKSELLTSESFNQVVDIANKLNLDDEEWMNGWELILSNRFTDPTRPITPEDWVYFFTHAFIDEEMPDTFNSECTPVTEEAKLSIRELAMMLACLAPTRFGHPTCRYHESGVWTLAKTSPTCAWIGANQVIGSVWMGIRCFQQNCRNLVFRKRVANVRMEQIRMDVNKAKQAKVDRILATLDGSTEYLRCLGVCEVWAEMVETPRLELMMPWNNSLREKWKPLEDGFPKIQSTNKVHAELLQTLWKDRETVSTLPEHMKRAATNKPTIGWPRFKALWIKGRQLASDFWYTHPGHSREEIFLRMENEFSETTCIKSLAAASEAYRARAMNAINAATRATELTQEAQAVAAEEVLIDETIQVAEQELEQISNTAAPGGRRTRSNLATQAVVKASKRLENLQKEKKKKEEDRKRKLEEAEAVTNQAQEAFKKPKPNPKPAKIKKPKAELTSLLELSGTGGPETDPPTRSGKRLAYTAPGKQWKSAAITITSLLALCHDILKNECDNMELEWKDLENVRSDLETKRMVADYDFLTGQVANFEKKTNRAPTTAEMEALIRGSRTCKSPTLDLYLGDKFVQQSIITLELLDTSEFFDSETGDVVVGHIKVKHLRPSLLSWMSLTEAADMCWHLKCIEHIKKKKKAKEFRLLIRQNFLSGYKEKMLSMFDKLVAGTKGKKTKKKGEGQA